MAERRRLPVLQDPKPPAAPPPGDAAEPVDRPPWHWIGFGVVAIFAAWLPLVYLAEALKRSVVRAYVGGASSEAELAARIAAMSAEERVRLAAIQALPHVAALALAAFLGGLLVGRFGAATRVREAALSGAAAASLALVLAWRAVAAGGTSALLAVVVPSAIAVAFSAWGGRTGVRMRRGDGAKSPE